MQDTSIATAFRAVILTAVHEAVRPAVAEAIAEALPEVLRRAALPEYMARAEAADYIGRSVRSLDHLRASGKLPWTKRGARVMVKTTDLDAYLDAGRVDRQGAS